MEILPVITIALLRKRTRETRTDYPGGSLGLRQSIAQHFSVNFGRPGSGVGYCLLYRRSGKKLGRKVAICVAVTLVRSISNGASCLKGRSLYYVGIVFADLVSRSKRADQPSRIQPDSILLTVIFQRRILLADFSA